MATQWLLIVGIILAVLYLTVKAFFYKNMAFKEERNSAVMRLTLQEAEILIRKHQLQLQRAMGNIDILTDEISILRTEIKNLRQRSNQYRFENEKQKNRIKELEQKIEALL